MKGAINRLIKNIVVVVFLCLLFIGCNNSVSNKNSSQVFSYNEAAGITSLDPAMCSRLENIWAVNQLFNGLVQLNDSLRIVPCIAKKWTISDDGLNYTFTLRNDVYFHDNPVFKNGLGRKVIATDFVFSFNRLLNEKTASPGVWVFNAVKKNITQYSFNAPNDSTFSIELDKEYRPFLSLLSMQYCSVIPHEAIEKHGTDFRNNPIGTGPFCFKLWVEGEKMVLLKNKHYFEKENDINLPYIEAVNIYFLKDRQTAFLEFIKGKFDFMSGVDGSYKDELLTRTGALRPKYDEKLNVSKIPFLKTDYLGFNLDASTIGGKVNALQQKKVRQAINYGFDRKKLVTYLRNNVGTAATNGFVPKGTPFYDSLLVGYEYNPEKAKILLKEAGFENGNKLPEIKLTTTATYQDVCEYIQSELQKIGINIKVEVLLPAVNSDMIANNKVPFFRKAWVADYADSENFMTIFYSKNFSPNGPNYTHFSNKKFDLLYEKSLTLLPADTLISLYKKMEQIIIEEAPVVPIYYDDAIFFYHKNITNLKGNSLNLLQLKKVKKT
jgi:peptide/nickel transport system substrate-binding protein